jgi:RNA polymerase sigma-70 factor (ECF subfamily)
MPPSPDATLADRARQGDSEAFRQLVERHGSPLFRLAQRLVADEAAAEDVVQEAFLRAWRALPSFDGRSELATWLHRITVNCAMDALRRRGQRGHELALVDEHPTTDDEGSAARAHLPANEPGPERHTLSGEVGATVTRVLATLSALERTAFVLRHYEGRSTAEIADTLGVNQQAGKHAVFRAVQKLRLALRPYVVAPARRLAGGT